MLPIRVSLTASKAVVFIYQSKITIMSVHTKSHEGTIITSIKKVKLHTGKMPHLATKSPVAQGSSHKK